jgi:6,7-dimethyl-8-ribityllumazine synthase
MKNKDIFIIGSIFYPDLLNNLFQGTKEAVNLAHNRVSFISVPGAFEIPGMAKKIIDNENPDLIITLGVSNSISALSIQSKIPIIFGIITAYNKEQAITRSSLHNIKNNKGYQAMQTGIDMLKIYDQYKK